MIMYTCLFMYIGGENTRLRQQHIPFAGSGAANDCWCRAARARDWCCSVLLQCVAVRCCSAVQCVAANDCWCRAARACGRCYSVLKCVVAVCVAVYCCSALQ